MLKKPVYAETDSLLPLGGEFFDPVRFNRGRQVDIEAGPPHRDQKAAVASCPPQIATPARAADAPVDDIVGLRPGLLYDEAVNVLKCHASLVIKDESGGYRVNTYGQDVRQVVMARTAKPPAPAETPEQAIARVEQERMAYRIGYGSDRNALKPGEEQFALALMGVPGQERLFGVSRQENYADDKKPTVESIVAALEGKYGAPSAKSTDSGVRLAWVYDTFGRKMSSESPVFQQCGRVRSSPTAGVSISPDCGLTIVASVTPDSSNAQLAFSLSTRVIHQSMGMEAIEATEKALGAADAAKKAEEVERAKQNVEKPKL